MLRRYELGPIAMRSNRHAATRYAQPLVAHDTGLPLATLGFHEEGGETAAVRALLEQVPVAGRLLTIDALYTTRETARLLVSTHDADYLMTVKKNVLSTLWERDAPATSSPSEGRAHRATRHRRPDPAPRPPQLPPRRPGPAAGPTPATGARREHDASPSPAHRASPQLAWNRGHWAVEVNHHIRGRRRLPRPRFAPSTTPPAPTSRSPHPAPHPLQQHRRRHPTLRLPAPSGPQRPPATLNPRPPARPPPAAIRPDDATLGREPQPEGPVRSPRPSSPPPRPRSPAASAGAWDSPGRREPGE